MILLAHSQNAKQLSKLPSIYWTSILYSPIYYVKPSFVSAVRQANHLLTLLLLRMNFNVILSLILGSPSVVFPTFFSSAARLLCGPVLLPFWMSPPHNVPVHSACCTAVVVGVTTLYSHWNLYALWGCEHVSKPNPIFVQLLCGDHIEWDSVYW